MAVNKVDFGGQTLIDLTGDTVTPADLSEGVTAHDASGQQIRGTGSSSGKLIEVTYGETSWSDILSILNAGNTPICAYTSSGFKRIVSFNSLDNVENPTQIIFAAVFPIYPHSKQTQTDSVLILTVTSQNTWHARWSYTGINIKAGAGMTGVYANNELTLDCETDERVDNIMNNLAPPFQDDEDYYVGDIVNYEDVTYIFTSRHTPGPFDEDEVAEYTLSKASKLENLIDVSITNPSFGQGLFFDGTKWVNFRSGFFVASYGNSTYAEVLAAYKANLMVYCRASSNSDPATGNQLRMAFLAYVNDVSNPTEFEFQYYRSVATHSNSQQGDQVLIYKLNSSGTWSVTTRNTFTKISVNSSTMSSTYNNGELILSAIGGGGGSTVVANPEDESSADLSKLKVDGITYAIPTADFGDVTEVHLVQSLPADASSHPTTLYLIEEV